MNSVVEKKERKCSSAKERYNTALSLISEGRYAEALCLLKKAEINNYKNKEDLYYSMFFCCTQIDDNENAMIYADKLIEINPQQGCLCKAAAFNRVENTEEALKFLLAARHYGSENPMLADRINELKSKFGAEEYDRIAKEMLEEINI